LQKRYLPAFDPATQAPFGEYQRCRALPFGFGSEQIGKPFDLSEVKTPILERATRERAWFSGLEAREIGERGLDSGDDGAAAMQMKFDNVFTSCRVRAGKPQDERGIERDSALRMQERANNCGARRW